MTAAEPPSVYCPEDCPQRSKQGGCLHSKAPGFDSALKLRDRGICPTINRHINEILRLIFRFLRHRRPKHLPAGPNESILTAPAEDDNGRQNRERIPYRQRDESKKNRYRDNREEYHRTQPRSDSARNEELC